MIVIALATLAVFAPQTSSGSTSGELRIVDQLGRPGRICPLKGTSVNAEIAGFGGRVSVVQTFTNPSNTPIEAIYTFPLPADAAVDRMRIRVGERMIEGLIRRRDEARRIYEAAKRAGQTAALLDQERPNIFSQSVANIVPGAEVQVEISYVQILKYEKGEFEFSYPMVVGPRFLSNAADPNKIDPPRAPAGTRTGAAIELTVKLDAGAPIVAMNSVLHRIDVEKRGESAAVVRLANKGEVPNRDFILRYRTATDTVQSALVTCYDEGRGGFFTLVLLPPKAPKAEEIAPREMIFVMDQSGSQQGIPIQKSKELTLALIKNLRPDDTFNVFGFNNTVHPLFTSPRPPTAEAISAAEKFVTAMAADGGTQLLEGLQAALKPAKDPERLRIVVFNTDGLIGDEPEVLDTIVKNRDTTRIFTFGIGNGVNRFLIDAMSMEGRGDSEIVTLESSTSKALQTFLQRTRSPILTDITARFSGQGVRQVTPELVPDVFSEKPIVIMGRFSSPAQTKLTLTGRLGGRPWTKTIDLRLSADPGTSAVASLWARKHVDHLQSRSYSNMTRRLPGDDFTEAITQTALEFGLMTQFTSFVAVEPRVVNVGGRQYTVRVPVEAADGLDASQGGNAMRVTRRINTYGSGMGGGGFGGGGLGGGAGAGGTTGGSTGGGGGLFRGGRPADEVSIARTGRSMVDQALAKATKAKKRALTESERRAITFETVVDQRLRSATGKVAIMVWLSASDKAALQKLRLAGFDPEITDTKLHMVFGMCDVEALKDLAELDFVDRIEALE